MASVSPEKGRTGEFAGFRLQFINHVGRRKSVRMGNITKAAAEILSVRVEQIVRCHHYNVRLTPELEDWLKGCSPAVLDKLQRVGLIGSGVPESPGILPTPTPQEATKMAAERVCEMCRFFQVYDDSEGFCHRFPPAFIGGNPHNQEAWDYPVVASNDGCGEFQGYVTPEGTPW